MENHRPEGRIYTVSDLNRKVRTLLEGELGMVWVVGEISNLARPRSGHLYFTLKDKMTQVRCAMFRMRVSTLDLTPEDGMEVQIYARVGLYEARGDYQLVAEAMEEVGGGALQRAFEALKKRLLAEGLFDPARKRPLPPFPQRLGVITSATGAALRDIIAVVERRFPLLEIILYPVEVQGEGAAATICAALTKANDEGRCDLLLLGRGGGSLEDLWPFNEERVARAIFHSRLPVVSAVGHEVDFTIADFVADLRAPTPSAAAELITPDGEMLRRRIDELAQRLQRGGRAWLQSYHHRLEQLSWRLRNPALLIQQRSQEIDYLEQRGKSALLRRLARGRRELEALNTRLQLQSPRHRLQRQRERQQQLTTRLRMAMNRQLGQSRDRLLVSAQTLETVSPLNTLKRGYALARRSDGEVVQRATDVAVGELVEILLGEGGFMARVEDIPKIAENAGSMCQMDDD
ncbi:MAG: exodeoxyribonuclease VII large subunit [Gammaproteobacteria bacterium]|nr:exodeoxyribonuclease VII large subunit [Gammaproteobacteria bacterium]